MSHALPPAILFDMDDTLLAFSEGAKPCWQSICREYAQRIEGIDSAALYDMIMATHSWFWSDAERHRTGRLDMDAARRDIVAMALARLGVHEPYLADEMATAYTRQRDEALHLFPQTIETLERLRARGARLALLTNGGGDVQRKKIERFGLARLFDCIIVEGEFGVGKPDERVFRHALQCLGVQPAQAWMVGDDLERDIRGAQQLGILAIWHDCAGRGLPLDSPIHPDHIIHTLAELL